MKTNQRNREGKERERNIYGYPSTVPPETVNTNTAKNQTKTSSVSAQKYRAR
ncbi:UNVERIFIED_CONTAM: hypothetical protein FKN15_020821 [Acipenser sinensis]